MEKELLEQLIAENLSIRKMAERLGKGQTTIRHWLSKYGLKTNYNQYGKKEYGEYKFCSKCQYISFLTVFVFQQLPHLNNFCNMQSHFVYLFYYKNRLLHNFSAVIITIMMVPWSFII